MNAIIYEPPAWFTDKNVVFTGPVPEENKQRILRDLNILMEKVKEDLGDILNRPVSIVDDETYEKYKFYEFLLNAENNISTEEK